MLSERQQLTIEHLKHNGEISNEEIIEFCQKKLSQSRVRSIPHGKLGRRRFSKNYYQEIIDHLNSI